MSDERGADLLEADDIGGGVGIFDDVEGFLGFLFVEGCDDFGFHGLPGGGGGDDVHHVDEGGVEDCAAEGLEG